MDVFLGPIVQQSISLQRTQGADSLSKGNPTTHHLLVPLPCSWAGFAPKRGPQGKNDHRPPAGSLASLCLLHQKEGPARDGQCQGKATTDHLLILSLGTSCCFLCFSLLLLFYILFTFKSRMEGNIFLLLIWFWIRGVWSKLPTTKECVLGHMQNSPSFKPGWFSIFLFSCLNIFLLLVFIFFAPRSEAESEVDHSDAERVIHLPPRRATCAMSPECHTPRRSPGATVLCEPSWCSS